MMLQSAGVAEAGDANDQSHTNAAELQPFALTELFQQVVSDPQRGFMKVFTSLEMWEFNALLEHLRLRIEAPRLRAKSKRRRRAKLGTAERLFCALSWIKGGDSFRKLECLFGAAKSSINADLRHVLKAITAGLDEELAWPDEAERLSLMSSFTGVFAGCVGIMDCTEHCIQRPQLSSHEHATYSAKHTQHSIKTLAVIDRLGYFRFVETGIPGRVSDREAFTRCGLYMNRGDYFSEEEWVAADGGFRGDGPIMYSFDARELGSKQQRMDFNLVFKEVRVQVENAFNRVKTWFSVLGNNKAAWNCGEDLLISAVHATVRLHNWLLRIRCANYCPSTNHNYLFRAHY